MNTKNNQRFQETEVRMEVAMLDIMKHMDFEKITVKRICEKAEVNRSTFYAHFVDIYDMLDKMEDYLGRELLKNYASVPMDEKYMFSEQSFLPFLRHIRKHMEQSRRFMQLLTTAAFISWRMQLREQAARIRRLSGTLWQRLTDWRQYLELCLLMIKEK